MTIDTRRCATCKDLHDLGHPDELKKIDFELLSLMSESEALRYRAMHHGRHYTFTPGQHYRYCAVHNAWMTARKAKVKYCVGHEFDATRYLLWLADIEPLIRAVPTEIGLFKHR